MREYVMPTMEGEVFAANEYIAACGDSGTTYYFECNAGSKDKYQTVYEETNGVPGLQTKPSISGWYWADNIRTLTYHACGEKHVVESTEDFLDGYVVNGNKVIPVIIWEGLDGNNTHCTEELDMDKWVTAKS